VSERVKYKWYHLFYVTFVVFCMCEWLNHELQRYNTKPSLTLTVLFFSLLISLTNNWSVPRLLNTRGQGVCLFALRIEPADR